MHNAAFCALGLDWEYLLLPVRPDNVMEGVRGLRGLGFVGANVTVPHKEAVMAALDEVTLEARAIGAVNTIVVQDGRLVGHNTDALGFLRALREAGFEPRGCKAVVLGAGGASRAVLYALLSARAQVTLVNRTPATARTLAAEFGRLFRVEIPVLANSNLAALQAAMEAADVSPLPEGMTLPPSLAVYDLVYNPLETMLLTTARGAGAQAIDGLGMLIHQGAAAFTLWTSQPAPLDVMRAAALGQESLSKHEDATPK
jgi:shikimate dehydrogenase